MLIVYTSVKLQYFGGSTAIPTAKGRGQGWHDSERGDRAQKGESNRKEGRILPGQTINTVKDL